MLHCLPEGNDVSGLNRLEMHRKLMRRPEDEYICRQESFMGNRGMQKKGGRSRFPSAWDWEAGGVAKFFGREQIVAYKFNGKVTGYFILPFFIFFIRDNFE